MKKKGGRKILGFMVKEEKEENRGSVEFQVFSFTNKIRRLASHLELHKKDFSSERGLRRLLGKRRRLLAYLAKKNRVRYKKLIGQLNIREHSLYSSLRFFILMSLTLRNSWNNPFSWNNELRKKGYESTAYKKRSHDSQYGPSTPINAWCSSTDRYS
ncbi:30S ribosomal protein S15 [Medicago truncatula]|uniref:30S ribosomal protein S15 n=2 Tax=Mesangiospermae TaxID=1437183 RepID=A0A072TJG9_MEDTR|nr:30S ribosomal protein S15 [Medicago truncatula]